MSDTIELHGLVYADNKEDILAVVCGLIDETQREYIFDRRKHDRYSLAIAVNATPIEDDQLGTEFEALTHDISAGGLSLVHNARIEERFLWLRFPGYNQPPLILEIVRQTQIGPFWMIAGKFRTDL